MDGREDPSGPHSGMPDGLGRIADNLWWSRHSPARMDAVQDPEGLCFLAGDFIKEFGDLGVPLVAVGFMCPEGCARQRIRTPFFT